MKSLFLLILFALILGACSNEVEEIREITGKEFIHIPELGINIESDGDILVFETDKEFQNTVSKIQSHPVSASTRLASMEYGNTIQTPDIVLNNNEFHSIYDDFVNAMSEAESYYDRQGGYEEFKMKYSMLYFPEEGDDYSAYLPVSDKSVAKLLNSKGEVIINREIIN